MTEDDERSKNLCVDCPRCRDDVVVGLGLDYNRKEQDNYDK